MRKLFVIIFAALMSLGATAQQVVANPTATMGAVAAPSLIGSYTGNLVEAATANRVAVMIQYQGDDGSLSGTATFFGGVRTCKQADTPISGSIANGVVVLNSQPRVLGCERVLKLKQVAINQMIGTMTSQDEYRPQPWNIVLTRTQ